MQKPGKVYETRKVAEYLDKRKLTAQYKKAKKYLLAGSLLQVRFKQRQPKGSGIWYFRINLQFRALAVFDDSGNLIVFSIDYHQ